MTYNKQELPRYVETAGKITVLTALTGVLIFAFVFILNIGKTELQKAEAQSGTATTTLTVLNTPPVWTVGQEGREEIPSSTSTPTNSGDTVSWIGRATDANNAPYFLIVCSTSATPTAQQSTSTLGTNPPICSAGTRFAVSTSTVSGQQARAATTTTEVAPFSESNAWWAWVCDDDPVNPRCSTTSSQGTTATNSSPFNVNRRPVFTTFNNGGPTNPGGTVQFLSSSTDPDVVDAEDTIFLTVCGSAGFSTTTLSCTGVTVASTSVPGSLANATTSRVLPAIIQDDNNYAAFPYVHDQHGHVASGGAQGVNVPYTVSNVAPTVAGGTLSLNGGSPITLTNPGAQTTGFTLAYTVADANSCDAVGGGNADEITGYVASVFRSGVGTSTCNGSAGSYNPNNCYPSGVATSTWNLACTASTTSCTAGGADDTIIYNCTFPLWFIADPTNGTSTDTNFHLQHWAAGVAGVDNNNATGSMSTSTTPVELNSLVAIGLQTNLIAYSQLEPGTNMPTLSASTTLRVLGNTGLNQLLGGDSMCGTYSPGNPCPVSATTTIPQSEQRYATSAVAYGSGTPLQPTSTPGLLLNQIPKPTSTSTPATGQTFWGIAVPGSISLAGSYTGQNTFTGAVSSPATW
ncbi:hypothetical protein K2P47_03090 [Patescibacteria group bacterium]|nr:hypothetical protein [Patescibacteria group bacterium]